MESARKISLKLHEKTTVLEAEAIETMKKNGLKINSVPDDSVSQWRGASEKGVNSLIGKVFSKAIYDKVLSYLAEYKKLNENK